MFLRIVQAGIDQTIECDSVRIERREHRGKRVTEIIPVRVGRDDEIHEVDPEFPGEVGVFLMNHEGKTIDTVMHRHNDDSGRVDAPEGD